LFSVRSKTFKKVAAFFCFRLKFLEHIIYFLIRTGKDYHFFPEILPAAWVTHIESLRYRYLKRQNLRHRSTMLDVHDGSATADLVPLFQEKDYNEFFFSDVGTRERNLWEFVVGRLMSDYIFLSFPAKPIQSLYTLQWYIKLTISYNYLSL
jgi:hypothetical protein